jgi:hypothetical protein
MRLCLYFGGTARATALSERAEYGEPWEYAAGVLCETARSTLWVVDRRGKQGLVRLSGEQEVRMGGVPIKIRPAFPRS